MTYSLKNYANLVKEMAISDFKLRYHGSVLGVFWSFLRPLLMFGVLYLIFSVFIRFDIENYALHLLLGVILWNFFAEATTLSLSGLMTKSPLIKKIAFPRTIIVVSSTLTALLSFIFNLFVFTVFFAFSGISVSPTVLLAPLFVVLLYFIALGASFLLTALYATLRDVKHIWEVLLQLGFWLTPIIYSVEMVPQKYHWFMYLNPMTRVIQYTRESVLHAKVSNLDGMSALFLATVIIFGAGFLLYRKRSSSFAEDL